MRITKTGVLLSAVAFMIFAARPASAKVITVILGPSTSPNGIVFSSNDTTGQLNMDIGGCPFTAVTCTAGDSVTGSMTIEGLTGSYTIAGDNSLLATFAGTSSGVDTWNIAGVGGADADAFTFGNSIVSATATLDWTQIVENSSGVTLLGTAAYSYTLTGGGGGSGHAAFSVQLAPLACNSEVTGPCTLANISGEPGDPPAAFGGVSAGVLGATPEPGTLLLLGSGLLGFAPLLRRRLVKQ